MRLRPRGALWVLAAVLGASTLIAEGRRMPQPAAHRQPALAFTEAAAEAGLAFQHVNGASADKHLPETMGSGGALADFDADGWLDVFVVDGGWIADPPAAGLAAHRLFRNRGNGTFEDATARSGIRHGAYGMGACAGDYDNDGDTDLYVTAVGPNALYRNDGAARFTDVTAASGTGSPLWSASCAFADLDRDGDLDLFVTSYVASSRAGNPFCGNARTRARFYCHPLNFEPLPNVLYRNDGRGTFTDISLRAGLGRHLAYGLGVVVADYDADGWPDVFVANDSVPNFLFHNTGDGGFEEIGLQAGVAMATDGRARAGMGTDAGDYDGDGRLDLVVTNLDFETHSLYRGLGGRLFSYATVESGIGFATLPFVGFGASFLDADHDGRLDLAIANGHIMDNAPQFRSGATYAQRNLLFRNAGGRRFAEVGRSAGPGFALEKVSRGLFTGDIDNDGDLDLLVTNNGQPADLLRNDSTGLGRSLLLRLVGTASNRDAIGATARVTAGGRTQVRDVRAGSSYLGQNDPRLHFGLGAAERAERIEIRWPSGATDVLRDVKAGQVVTVKEGAAIVDAAPFTK